MCFVEHLAEAHCRFAGCCAIGDLLATKPERVVEQAIKGMLPKTKLGRAMGAKLKVYAGPNHPHAAQRPVPFEIKQVAQ